MSVAQSKVQKNIGSLTAKIVLNGLVIFVHGNMLGIKDISIIISFGVFLLSI